MLDHFPRSLPLFLLLLAIVVGSPAKIHGQCVAIPDCELVWADEFAGTSVDLAKWTFQLGDGTEVGLPGGWGNNELQYYTADNATVADGFLTITAREESVEPGFDYSSARLRSLGKGDWTFGRMEMRAKLPIGQGLWPAFWMLSSDPTIYGPWAASGEIDIMEYIGSDPNRVFGTLHYGGSFPANTFSSTDTFLASGTFADDFHVFAVEWEFGEIRWYLDGVEFARRTDWFSTGGPFPAPFDVDFHLLLNLAVGGNLPGPPDATTVFPQEYVIDYVRVYESPNEAPSVAITFPTAADALVAGEPLTIVVDATDDGSITQVEFLQGNAVLGEVTEPPYELTVPNVAAGCYSLKARARDDQGVLAVSEPVEIVVGGGCQQAPYRMTPTPIPGKIEIEDYDLGGDGVAYFDVDAINAGGAYRPDQGVDLEGSSDAGFGFNAGFIVDGEWIEHTVDVTAGVYDVALRVASNEDGGALRLEFDGVDKTGIVSFPGTGGWQSWTTVTVEDVELDGGVQVMRVQMLDTDFNLNRITIGEPAPPEPDGPLVFDDMEHGNPFGSGWFTFGGAVGGGGIGPSAGDLPPEDGGAFSLETGWGSGGVPGFFGGFGRTRPLDLGDATHFSFWIHPDAGQDYTLEINLQDDDNGDDTTTQPDDDEFQYSCVVSPTGPCAVAGGGWQRVSIPLADFVDDPSFLFGGNDVLDPIGTANGGNGRLINVVFAVIGNSGSDATFRTDYWVFTEGPPADCAVDDFEDGDLADWTLNGLGHVNQESAEVVDDGGDRELALTSDGATAYLGADNAGFLHREVTGDFRFEATIDSKTMTTGKEWRKAGLMVRAGLDPFDVRLLALLAPVQERLQFVARETAGGPGNVKVATEVPGAPGVVRLAIERDGQTLAVQYSLDDGATWITPTTGLGGSIDLPALPETLRVGLATVSNNISVTTTALFDDVSICPLP